MSDELDKNFKFKVLISNMANVNRYYLKQTKAQIFKNVKGPEPRKVKKTNTSRQSDVISFSNLPLLRQPILSLCIL